MKNNKKSYGKEVKLPIYSNSYITKEKSTVMVTYTATSLLAVCTAIGYIVYLMLF